MLRAAYGDCVCVCVCTGLLVKHLEFIVQANFGETGKQRIPGSAPNVPNERDK